MTGEGEFFFIFFVLLLINANIMINEDSPERLEKRPDA
jgi:hypothetical protein